MQSIPAHSVPTNLAATQRNFTVKIRKADGSETRRFGFDSTSFSGLSGLVKSLFAINEQETIVLKWKDEEGDLITMSSDAELAEAVKVSGQVLHVVLSTQGVSAESGATAPLHAPTRSVSQPRGDQQGKQAPLPAALGSGAQSPSSAPVPKAVPQWKQEKLQLAAKWKEERCKLKEQIRLMKAADKDDKKVLKEKIQGLRQQVRASHQELKRMPKDNVMVARFVKDVSLPDGTEVAPGAQLIKTWRFRNESVKAWPAGCQLLWVGRKADRMNAPEATPVVSCAPGQEVDASVPIVAPTQPGRYTAYFRLAGPAGRKFGQRVWAMIIVFETSSSSDEGRNTDTAAGNELLVKYATQLKGLGDMGYGSDVKLNVRLLRRFDGNLEKAVAVLIKRQQRKAALPAFA